MIDSRATFRGSFSFRHIGEFMTLKSNVVLFVLAVFQYLITRWDSGSLEISNGMFFHAFCHWRHSYGQYAYTYSYITRLVSFLIQCVIISGCMSESIKLGYTWWNLRYSILPMVSRWCFTYSPTNAFFSSSSSSSHGNNNVFSKDSKQRT